MFMKVLFEALVRSAGLLLITAMITGSAGAGHIRCELGADPLLEMAQGVTR